MKWRKIVSILAIAAVVSFAAVLTCKGAEEVAQRRRILERRKNAWSRLQQTIRRQNNSFKGSAGIVIKDLATGWEIGINKSQRFAAASMVKIPIMAACFKAAADGRLSLAEEIRLDPGDIISGSGVLKTMPCGSSYSVEKLIELMICQSDNTATNILIGKLGERYLNSFFSRAGLRNTCLRRKMMDFSKRKQGVENFTTAEDICLILEQIYRKKFISAQVSDKCMDMLLRQKMKDRIPKQLPKNTPIAHKTGLERSVCHDAGIVFAPKGDFMICVLTKSKGGPYKMMKDFISRMALAVYNTYLPPGQSVHKGG